MGFIVLGYLILINILSSAMCCYDKIQARINGRRISEYNLMVLSVLGGAFAMYFTMKVIRHKTRKKKFMIGLPVILILQISLIAFLIVFMGG